MRISTFELAALLLLVSCEHKDLCYEHPHDKEVRVIFDWGHIKEKDIPEVTHVVFYDKGGQTVSEFDLPPEGGTVMMPNGTYDLTAYNTDKYGNIFKETHNGQISTTPVSLKVPEMCYETPDFLCLDNEQVSLTDSEDSRVIVLDPVRRTASVTYEIHGLKSLERASEVYAVLSGCSVELDLYKGICIERKEDGVRHSISVKLDPKKPYGQFYLYGGGFTPENREKEEHEHILTIYIVGRDGKYKELDMDITEQIPCDNPIGVPMQDFHIEVKLDELPDDWKDGSTEGTFDPDVKDWEEIETEIPL